MKTLLLILSLSASLASAQMKDDPPSTELRIPTDMGLGTSFENQMSSMMADTGGGTLRAWRHYREEQGQILDNFENSTKAKLEDIQRRRRSLIDQLNESVAQSQAVDEYGKRCFSDKLTPTDVDSCWLLGNQMIETLTARLAQLKETVADPLLAQAVQSSAQGLERARANLAARLPELLPLKGQLAQQRFDQAIRAGVTAGKLKAECVVFKMRMAHLRVGVAGAMQSSPDVVKAYQMVSQLTEFKSVEARFAELRTLCSLNESDLNDLRATLRPLNEALDSGSLLAIARTACLQRQNVLRGEMKCEAVRPDMATLYTLTQIKGDQP